MPAVCLVHDLGTIDYQQAWRLQETLAGQIAHGDRLPTLLLLEHPHTYTFGRRGQAENLLWQPAELAQRGVSVYWVDRGGDVTYHGPGQLVGYPLLALGMVSAGTGEPASGRLPQADYMGYLRKLEQMLIAALDRLGVIAEQIPGLTGVWRVEAGAAPAKLAAIGVKVDARGISRHGFALNVNPVMTYWEGIIGCGLREYASTSLAEVMGRSPAMEEVTQAVVESFGATFGFEMRLQALGWAGLPEGG
jgi:lipoate-protein ligase B